MFGYEKEPTGLEHVRKCVYVCCSMAKKNMNENFSGTDGTFVAHGKYIC